MSADKVSWGIKFNDEGFGLGIATPEVACRHVIGPGSGSGGVGIERSVPTNHFITYAGILDAEPAEQMNRLSKTLDFRNQPRVTTYSLQQRP